MIDCVSISTSHLFTGNPIYEQHRLRHDCIVQRQRWKVPTVRNMEYDQYDNPAAWYLVWRDEAGKARGSSRLYPTDRPYMLQEIFPHLVTNTAIPKTTEVWEGSRFCVDEKLPIEKRRRIVQELIIGYLEFGLAQGITRIVGVMYPAYCRNIFMRNGWDVEWLGDVSRSEEGYKIIAGSLTVSRAVLKKVREKTGIYENVLHHGEQTEMRRAA
ncbi:autoinducer synthesis protein [Rhodomicrobium udaipurense JA643]|uniref:Acyl-homoserine-lactone synthase n=1 Tax=Rhodomicrobium udaipurense TaxID=1202716 RepID=A0A8I1KKK6_9HYPH|nr:acyl-homoserine-lactone synthase [Rhodomicrobium udaipurense]KAI93408.1 autoinducer synthesis protein [Rhodomicrobium udaipurense JA643]MBJ7542053.1 autoinducer synthase [Rhodomicrobium udaipurense]